MLFAPSAASADFGHVVLPGESLSSIAALDGLSVDQLAAANGLSPDAQLIAGSTLMIPPQGGGSVSSSSSTATGSSAAATTPSSAGDGDGDGDDVGASTAASGAASAGGGSYIVQPGDTLSAIAARAGTTVDQLAAANGLDPNGLLQIGAALSLPGAGSAGQSSASAAAGQPVGAPAEGSPGAPPYPTPERVSASQVGDIAAANGVPPSLAQAIGWQESGFNNDLVSSAGARGVMQILPGTWSWINGTLAPRPLAPASAVSNVTGGVLMLHSLLNATGGNQALAAAGYYQGLPSVERNGMYSDTQQYVNNVMSLARQFGGG